MIIIHLKLVLELVEPVHDELSDLCSVPHEPLVLYGLEDGVGHGAAHWVPPVRVEVLHLGVGEAVGQGLGGDDGRYGVTVAHGLAHGDDVRDGLLLVRLEGPPVRAHSAEADLDLVGDADAAGLANQLVGAAEERFRVDDLATATLEALRDEAARGLVGLLQAVDDGLDVGGVQLAEILARVVAVPARSRVLMQV